MKTYYIVFHVNSKPQNSARCTQYLFARWDASLLSSVFKAAETKVAELDVAGPMVAEATIAQLVA